MRSGVTSSTGWPSWVGRNPALWCPEREVGKAPPLAPQLNHATAPRRASNCVSHSSERTRTRLHGPLVFGSPTISTCDASSSSTTRPLQRCTSRKPGLAVERAGCGFRTEGGELSSEEHSELNLYRHCSRRVLLGPLDGRRLSLLGFVLGLAAATPHGRAVPCRLSGPIHLGARMALVR